MIPSDAPSPSHPPKQSRSRRTLERIVRASMAILEEDGPDALTVQAIVSRAGSSVGSFYARFSGKDELLDYLGERAWREAAARWDDAMAKRDWSGVDLRGLVDGSIRLLSEVGRSRAAVLRALGRAPGGGAEAFEAFQAHILAGVEALLLERTGEILHPSPVRAVRLALRAALAVLEAPADDQVTSDDLAEEASRMMVSYLIPGDEGGTLGAGQVDFFDIWG